MTAALDTLIFLATLWLLVVLGAAMLEDRGERIAAALKGRLARAPTLQLLPVRARVRVSQSRSAQPVMRATPRWRDAA